MNDELTQAARGIIDKARRYEAPRPQNKARVRAALLGALGGAAMTTTTGSAVAAFKIGMAAKVAVGVTAAAFAGGLAWHFARSPAPTHAPDSPARVHETPSPAVVEANEVVEQAPQRKVSAPTNHARRLVARPVPVQVSTTSQLTEETNQLGVIHRHLQAGDAAGALTRISAYQRVFKNGILREESDAAHVTA